MIKRSRLFVPIILLFIFSKSFSQKAPANLVYVDKSGVLRWTKDNKEAAFFGVNYTVPFAYGYRSIKALGKDIKKEIDADVYHLARIGCDAFRVHVWDTEISDSLGNLLTNEHLELFDYLVAQLKKRNIKIIITPIAFWGNGYPERDERTPGFSRVFGKGRATVNDTAIRAQEAYVQQFFKHVNPYTGSTYTADPDVIAVEVNNEPNHSGPKSGVTSYISRLVAAIKSTGVTKPIFYNISENPYYADATAATNIDGVSFQWYPSGLVAGREQRGNFLPNVDYYKIPFDTIPAYRNKARMVYEFDAADLLQSYMYPAIARSFKTAGFQWATQFAYDPMATAYGNTEYQTHYLNLAYTPSKAISLLIASKAFHQVPRLQKYAVYPADSSFDVFRVSYRENLSELNSDTAFYYSNTTSSIPKKTASLKHIAGVGSSPAVQYSGTGAYFLDKLEDGIWRLEVMPDAIHIRDPFERASPKKEVTRIQWQANAMQVSLPELGNTFGIWAINEGNQYKAIAANGKCMIAPGTYLLNRKGTTEWKDNKSTGNWKLEEFAAPQPFDTTPYLAYHPATEAVAGQSLTLHLQAVGIDSASKVLLQVNGSGRGYNRPVVFQHKNGYDYTAEISADALMPGILSYKIILQKGDDYYSYPGNVKGNPFGWDYTNTDAYELKIIPASSCISLFNAATDRNVTTYTSNWRGSDTRLIPADRPGSFAYRIAMNELSGDPTLALQYFFGDKMISLKDFASYKTIVVRARTTSPQPQKAKLTLITKDAAAYAASITLSSAFQDLEIPISRLQKDSMLLLPRPYPGFMPLWFTASGNAAFSLDDAEKLQLTIGADVLPADFKKLYSMDVEAIWLKQ